MFFIRKKKASVIIAATMLCILIFASATNAQALFEDSFEDGNLIQPDWTNGIGAVVEDPTDSGNMVLKCPADPNWRTHSGMSGGLTPISDTPLEMIFKFNMDYAGDKYAYFTWSLRTTLGLQNGQDWNSSGYGFTVSNDKKSFSITKSAKDGAGSGKVQVTDIAKITLPYTVLTSGWNTGRFVWGKDGALALYINENEILSATDLSFPLGFVQIAYKGFVNNTSASNGRYMYFDDITVKEKVIVPEPPPVLYTHPKMLFGPEDLPEMRSRSEQSAVGRRAIQSIRGWVDYAMLNENAPLRSVYLALKNEDTETLKNYTDGWWKGNLSLALSLYAFDCLIRDDSTSAGNLAAALAMYAKVSSGKVNVPGFTGVIGADLNIGYSYDFLYNYMTEDQRNVVRSAIAAVTKGKTLYGMDLPHESRGYNVIPYETWVAQLALAIEDEPGYDPNLYTQAVELMDDYLTYGINSTGAPNEDMHYFNFGMSNGAPMLMAMSRRGEVLYDNPDYVALKNWYIHSMEPYGYRFSMLGDTPNDMGGLLANYVLMKWLNPDDPVIDFIWRNRVGDDYTQIRYRGDFLFAAMFGLDWNGGENTEKAPAPDQWGVDNVTNPTVNITGEWNPAGLNLPDSFSDFNRGLFITRSDWSKDAMAMEFETNSNANGPSHTHSNSNDFTLSAFGQKWAIDRGFHIFESRDHSIVQIDGKGEGFFQVFGKAVGFLDSQLATVSIGDAKNSYDYRYTFKSRIGNDENKGYNWEPAYPDNSSSTATYRASENPVENAFRSVMMIRGSNPYVLVLDDIQKDQSEHLYEWLMQVPNELDVKSIQDNDIVLGLNNENADSPRLLVKSIQSAQTIDPTMRDTYTPIRLETYEVKNSPKTGYKEKFGLGKRLVISSRSASPDFKTLLFPYKPGASMPKATWQQYGSQLTVEWNGQKDEYTFRKLSDGRTGFGMIRNGGESFMTVGLAQFGPVNGISVIAEGEGPNVALDNGNLSISGTGWKKVNINASGINQIVDNGAIEEIIRTATGVELIEKVKSDAPVAEDYDVETFKNVSISGSVDAIDPEGGEMTYTLEEMPANGVTVMDSVYGEGGWSYEPNSGFTGIDSFVVKITDSSGASSTSAITVTVKDDQAPPEISGTTNTLPNSNGWYNTDVTVHFTATDSLSGIDSISPDNTLTTDGYSQTATGTATDKSGNSASFDVTGISIDKTPPEIVLNLPEDGAEIILNENAVASWDAIDNVSGIAATSGTVPGGSVIDTSTVGENTFSVEAEDMAGNRVKKTVKYYVRYKYSGILKPINEDGSSIFKGNNVSVKFYLQDANENYVSGATAKLYMAKIENSVAGQEIEAPSEEGNVFRYDMESKQYIFNLKTKNLENGVWQLRISLDDGTSKYVSITLSTDE